MRVFQTILPYNHVDSKPRRKMVGFTIELEQYRRLENLTKFCHRMTISEMIAFIVEQYLNGNIEVDCRAFIERIEKILTKGESYRRDKETKRQRYHDNKQLGLFDLRINK